MNIHQADLQWLVSSDAAPFLEETLAGLRQRTNIVRIAKRLRRFMSPARSALVLELVQLRIRGRKKFHLAEKMFFTRRGLEQSTDERIARFKASRFAAANVADVCCSIGGDLLGLAQRGAVTGFDRDGVATTYAAKNLGVYGFSAAVETRALEDIDLTKFDAIHVDPDRRSSGRTTNAHLFCPSFDDILRRLPAFAAAGIKVAPATRDDGQFAPECERQWIGNPRECKQQMIWLGPAAHNPGCRSAVLVHNSGEIDSFVAGREAMQSKAADSPMHQFLYEPHPAILAAGLTDAIANQFRLNRIAPEIVYLTGDQVIENRLLSRFIVIEVVAFNLSETISVMKRHQIGTIEVKQRGVPEYVAEPFKRIKPMDGEPGVIFVTRDSQNQIVVVAKRDR
jgi:hypothetical protein